jgi:NAD(P)-dependent dehydrogenase (short-subunit alcohol dehydrogenase family)
MNLATRTAFITGAANGMGRALAFSLSREGAHLGLVDVDENRVRSLAEELSCRGGPCAWVVADVRRRHEVNRAVQTLADRLGEPDILVASAGVLRLSRADELMVDQVEETLQVNFLGAVYAIDAVLPGMLSRRSGHIVGMASLAASRGIPYEAAYGASKAALGNYLESLRPGLLRCGVTVTTVYPGFVWTPLLEGVMAQVHCRSTFLRLLTKLLGPRLLFGLVEPDAAARKITAAIVRRRRVLSFPLSTRLLTQLAHRVPAFVYDWAMSWVTDQVALASQTTTRQAAESLAPSERTCLR